MDERIHARDQDRRIRTYQIRQNLLARPRDPAHWAVVFEERPQALANCRWKHALQVLERRSPKVHIVGVKTPKRDLKRLGGEDERKQHKNMR